MLQPLAIDTETALAQPGQMAPLLVCVTSQCCGASPELYDSSTAESTLARNITSGQYCLIGHNVAYDMAVLCEAYPALRREIFRAYREDRVTDTMLRQKLLDIRAGQYRGRQDEKGVWKPHGYTLEDLGRRCAGLHLKKTGFRLFYKFFAGVPARDWDAHAKTVQARARAYRDGGEDVEFALARKIIADDKRWTKELEGLLAAEPSEARTYALEDATATLEVYQAQEKHVRFLDDQYRRARYAFALHLSSAWGLRTDPEGVERLRAETQLQYDELFEELQAIALVRADGTRDTKAAKRIMVEVCKAEGLTLRRTDAHVGDHAKCKGEAGTPLPAESDECAEHISLDADACRATGDERLEAYAELSTLKKVLSNDIEAVLRGTWLPIHTRYDMAETGRTTSSGPNIQNWVRSRPCRRCKKGKLEDGTTCLRCSGRGYFAGVRECFIPRQGMVFAQADYPQLELYALAQCCVSWLGFSKLADALNGGLDPHTAVAAVICGTTYEDAVKRAESDDEVYRARQTAKVANFGFPGGLGIAKLIAFAKKGYGVELTEGQAKALKEQWYAAWPEMPHYFARINALCDTPDGKATVESLFTKRVRGGASYCAACNNGFQALGSDCAQNACWNITCALYDDHTSPLFNSRLVAFVHDEFIVETPDRPQAHEAAHELARLMAEGANVYLPDVPIKLEKLKPLLMRRWSKSAKQVFKEGRLVPWQ